MNMKEKGLNLSAGSGNNIKLLRIGVIFLSMVSFFTTANGMLNYIFINDSVIAYAASGAIQGILLALSMNLPGYLRNIYRSKKYEEKRQISKWEKYGLGAFRFLRNTFLAACALFLTIVTIFCSSWFSYIYIADIIHTDSWDADSELLVQQTYRTELYNARDYAHNYRIYLEEDVGRKLLRLDEQTHFFSDDMISSGEMWENERKEYVTDNGTAAASYMATVINAMERALPEEDSGENSSQEERELAATAITDAKKNIEERMGNIQQNLVTLDNNIKNYNDRISGLTNQINRAAAGVDITNLNNSIDTYTRLISDTSQRQAELQTEYLQLDSALLRLPYYEVLLGLTNSTSAISIRRDLLRLQTEFFETEPDEEKLLDISKTIFGNLRKAARQTVEGEGSETDLSYTSLLVQMNQLLQSLTDYAEIKDIESDLNQLIEELRLKNSSATNADDEAAPFEHAESISHSNPSGTVGTVSSGDPAEIEETILNSDPSGATETVSSADTVEITDTVSSNEPVDSKSDDSPKEISTDEWQNVWGERIDELKSQISAMPVYTATANTENETSSILSESQMNVLINYDRDASGRTLDDMIRRYISKHNAIYQGIIYLQSPYRSLALFALLLALSFDLSGFIFGFVALQDESSENEPKDGSAQSGRDVDSIENAKELYPVSIPNSNEKTTSLIFTKKQQRKQTAWSIHKTLTPYIILTGDYECQNGTYYYKTFKDGVLYYWAVQDSIAYTQGIYIQENTDKEWGNGKELPKDEQEILFARQSENPKDGIYRNCQMIYDEGSLILSKENQQVYIAGIDEYVPVHCYSPSQGESRTIPSKKLTTKANYDQVIVVALNTKGTRIAAIYIIEHI